MSKQKSRRHEAMLADVERWNLELANEIGVIAEVRADSLGSGRRPVLKSAHFTSALKNKPESDSTCE